MWSDFGCGWCYYCGDDGFGGGPIALFPRAFLLFYCFRYYYYYYLKRVAAAAEAAEYDAGTVAAEALVAYEICHWLTLRRLRSMAMVEEGEPNRYLRCRYRPVTFERKKWQWVVTSRLAAFVVELRRVDCTSPVEDTWNMVLADKGDGAYCDQPSADYKWLECYERFFLLKNILITVFEKKHLPIYSVCAAIQTGIV